MSGRSPIPCALAGLDVPVLVHAFPDAADKMLMGKRRDSFCGKMSVCNNLWQYGIKLLADQRSTRWRPLPRPSKPTLAAFAATCRIVKGLRDVTRRRDRRASCRLQHRPLQRKTDGEPGITVETLDLSEVIGRVGATEG